MVEMQPNSVQPENVQKPEGDKKIEVHKPFGDSQVLRELYEEGRKPFPTNEILG